MIEVLNLSKQSKKIGHSISFTVEKGEIVGLVGANGSEKTKICDMISGFSPYLGSVSICGTEVSVYPIQTKGKMGYMPEKAPVYCDMTVNEYLGFAAKLKKANAGAVSDIIFKFGIEHIESVPIGRLPFDMLKIISLAAVVINNPEVLILDCPLKGLSPDAKNNMLGLISEISQDKAVLMCGVENEEIFTRIITIGNTSDFSGETDEILDNDELEGIFDVDLLKDVSIIDKGDEEEENE